MPLSIVDIMNFTNYFSVLSQNKTPEGELYERSGISAESKGDSLIISQDNNEIALVRVNLN